MKLHTMLSSLALAGLPLATPATAFAKDKHHHHHHSSHKHVYVEPYCAPVHIHTVRPYYYSRPSVSFGFYSTPAYYSRPAYYYDSYPVRTVYRGVPADDYRYRASASDELAVDVQRALARRGYYRGEIDGDVGPGTRAAIRSYQYNRGMTVTGRIDNALLRSLGLS